MTTMERVLSTRRQLTLVAIARSLVLGVSAGLLVMVVVTMARIMRGSDGGALGWSLAIMASLVTGLSEFRRLRGPGFSVPRVSLWIEEHAPALQYALVTAVEGGGPAELDRSVAAVDWSPATRRAARRALAWPVLGLMGCAALLLVSDAVAPVVSRIAGDTRGTPRGVAGELDVALRVTPPAYARRDVAVLRNPSVVRALVGSEVRVTSPANAIIALEADRGGVPRTSGPASWRVGAQPVALRVRSGDASRLVTIDPLPDSAPVVVLREPTRDTVLADPSGTFTLGADARDDLGLRAASFEYIVSSGSGESFTFASGAIGARAFGGTATGSIAGRLSLGALGLKPGDFVHVRAVATDLRDDTASARGASETRTIRIARAGELDSVAIEAAAPPEADKAILSQRMLINLTEALVRRRPRIDRATLSAESGRIGRDQARLRKQVSDIVFSRLGDDPSGEHFHGDGHQHEGQELRPALTPDELLKAAENATVAAAGAVLDFEGDETPVVAVNRPLLEAYNFMWEAGRELEQSAPERALPPMYRALDAIQRARAAERLYLRSRPPRAVVDVERVRLQGKDRGSPAAREPRAPATGAARAALARFARVVGLAAADPAAAADSLLLLRIDLLGAITPDAAAAAAAAADALRRGRDAGPGLAAFRNALGSGVQVADSLSRWSGIR